MELNRSYESSKGLLIIWIFSCKWKQVKTCTCTVLQSQQDETTDSKKSFEENMKNNTIEKGRVTTVQLAKITI